ncbi:GNAT family N-acetyltransferase [Candidatus Gracilibacteria bacterium]|nr:GNAT family N-acetyltransferase [Candidatus Gracilibacteria bacterium]
MTHIISLDLGLSLIPFSSENSEQFTQSIKVNDILSKWKNKGISIEEVKDNVGYYVNFLCDPEKKPDCWEEFTTEYNVLKETLYGVIHNNTWIGILSDRSFGSDIKRRQLGEIGLEIFEKFQNQGLGTLLVQVWLQYIQNTLKRPELYISVDSENIPGTKFWNKIAKATPEFNHHSNIFNIDLKAFYMN